MLLKADPGNEQPGPHWSAKSGASPGPEPAIGPESRGSPNAATEPSETNQIRA
jgi:hypothetical protein